MDKGIGSDLFVNDGSFMEKFKQMQKEMEEKSKSENSKNTPVSTPTPGPSKVSLTLNKRPLDLKASTDTKRVNPAGSSSGKLAFSLKQKSKVSVAPVNFGMDEEEEEGDGGERGESGSHGDVVKRQRVGPAQGLDREGDVAPAPPSDYTVRKVIDRLANLVAKNGRQHEHVTRQRNPGDTPFKFLFDESCADYKYYEYRLMEEEKALSQSKESHSSPSPYKANSSSSSSGPHRSGAQQISNYQTSASALYGAYEESSSSGGSGGADPVAMMEFYMKKAAQEERRRPPKLSKDEMPPPPSLQGGSGGGGGRGEGKKGHHMGDFIPPEELEKFMARCNDAAARKAAQEAAEKARIQADNIGHRLLSKMGWKEGEGLGSDKSGRADPVMAGNVKKDNLGVGAVQPGEVTADDDIYDQYKKRMMLGYRYRPNPLGNPRKSYY